MTIKRLILVRHAKSSWEEAVNDKLRPLNERGREDAKLVSAAFKALNIIPDSIYSSTAKRALETCNTFVESLSFEAQNSRKTDQLYDFQGETALKFIKSLNDDEHTVMIFGHNPTFTSISNIFGSTFMDNLPTCGLVMIEFDSSSWKTIDKGQTTLKLIPRDFK